MLDVDAGLGTEAPVDCNLDFLGILKLSAFLIFLGNCSLTIMTYIYFFLGLSDPQSGNQQSNIQQIDNKESDNRHSKNQHSGNQQSDNEESDDQQDTTLTVHLLSTLRIVSSVCSMSCMFYKNYQTILVSLMLLIFPKVDLGFLNNFSIIFKYIIGFSQLQLPNIACDYIFYKIFIFLR